jgi:AbrB family looped-hinge helix DNA binding protein
MTTALISPKYQIVIPKAIRNKLDLKPGQRLSITEKDGHIEISPMLSPEQLVGLLSDCAHIPFEREQDRELP